MKTKILLVLLTSFFFGLLAGAQEIAVTRGPGITSVTGTPPIVSSGGSTPAISCTAAGAGVSGCFTSAAGKGVYDAGILADSYGNFYATSTLDLVSSTDDATTSTTVAAVTIRPTVNVTNGDLILNVEDSVGTNVFTVNEQGGVVAEGRFTARSASGGLSVGSAGNAAIDVAAGSTTASITSLAVLTGGATCSAASGVNAWAVSVNGARIDFGAGASDYASSDGTTVTFASPVTAAGALITNATSIGVNGVAGTTQGLQGSGGATYINASTTNKVHLRSSGGTAYLVCDATTCDATGQLSSLTGSGTAGSGTGITVNTTGAIRPFVHKITVTSAAMTAAATTDITIWTLPAKARLNRVIGDYTVVFAGGALTDVDVTCGKTAGANEYLLTHDVDTATGTFGLVAADIGAALLGAAVPTLADVNWSGTQAVICRFTCAGANCNAATTGSVTYYLEGVTYP